MWFVIAFLVVSVGMMLFAKTPTQKKPEAQEFKASTSEEGESIPMVFGSVWVGKNVIRAGNFSTSDVTEKVKGGPFSSDKNVTTGYKYYANIHLAFCLGCLDFIRKIKIEDKVLIDGNYPAGTHQVNSPSLFGGDKKGGGISGYIEILDGNPSQVVPRKLKLVQTGGLGILTPDYQQRIALVPDYRGISSVILYGGSLLESTYTKNPGDRYGRPNRLVNLGSGFFGNREYAGMYLGTSAYLKDWKILIQRIDKKSDGSDQWYKDKAKIMSYSNEGLKNFSFETKGRYWDGEQGNYNASEGAYYLSDGSEWATFRGGDEAITDFGRKVAEATIKITSSLSRASKQRIHVLVRVARFGYEPDVTLPSSSQLLGTRRDGDYIWYDLLLPCVSGTYPFKVENPEAERAWFDFSVYLPEMFQGFDMNPAHIIRECLTDKFGGMGEPESIIDDASFIYAADYLYERGIGVSLPFTQEGAVEDFISEVLRHINGFLYIEPKTGKYTLKIVIDDYDVNDLVTLDKKNIIKLDNYSKPTFTELLNQAVIKYKDIENDTDRSITIQDIALVSMSGGEIRSKTFDYTGFTSRKVASIIAARDLKSISVPTVSCDIELKRSVGLSMRQGDAFILNWPKYFINNKVMRVTEMDFGNAKDNVIKISCIEDLFSLPSAGSISIDDEIVEDNLSEAIEHSIAFEMPYIELAKQIGAEEAKAQVDNVKGSSLVCVAASKPESGSSYAELKVYDENVDDYVSSSPLDYCPSGSIYSDIDLLENEIAIIGDIGIDSGITLPAMAQINDEVVLVESIIDIYITEIESDAKLLKVKRGYIDTQVNSHNSGAKVTIWGAGAGYAYASNYYLEGEIAKTRVSPIVDSEERALYGSMDHNTEIHGRLSRPYTPQNVRIDGVYFPSQLIGNIFKFEWSHRNKISQVNLGKNIGWYEDDPTLSLDSGYFYELEVTHNDEVVFYQTTYDNFMDVDLSDLGLADNVVVTIKQSNGENDSLYPFVWTFDKLRGVSKPINLVATLI